MTVSLLRTLFLYLLIIFCLRIMGKRQLGELQPSELVVTILISNIATLPIQEPDIPFLGGAVPILAIVCFEVFFSCLSLKSRTARRLFTGSPRVLIRDGIPDRRAMEDLRFSLDDLLEQLRCQGVFDLRQVVLAIAETNGQLSLYRKDQESREGCGPPLVIISDGVLVPEHLALCGLTEDWLNTVLKGQSLTADQVFLMTCDRRANWFIVPISGKEAVP